MAIGFGPPPSSDLSSYMRESAVQVRLYVSGASGSGGNDGLSPGSAFQTIAQAIAALAASGYTGEIIVQSGTYIETVRVENRIGLIIRGGGGKDDNLGTVRIQAPSPTANCIEVRGGADHAQFENITTLGPVGAWTGIGWDINGSSYVKAFNCRHRGLTSTTVDATNGGKALLTQNTEKCHFENFSFSRCNRGFHISNESSGGHMITTHGNNSFREALLIDGTASVGGWEFNNQKFVQCGEAGADAVVVNIGPDPALYSQGQNTFIACDWVEGSFGGAAPTNDRNKVLIRANHNTFIAGAAASPTHVEVSGHENRFTNWKHSGRSSGNSVVLSGNRNRFIDSIILGNISDTGVDNVLEGGYAADSDGLKRQIFRDRDTTFLENGVYYGTAKSGASHNGYPWIKGQTSAPADTEVATGEVVTWYDNTTGNPLLKLKGKDAAGAVSNQTLASKAYADSIAAGLDPHASVKVATTANITLSGTQTIDGVAVVAADRVLVKNQTTTTQNGIYVVAAGAWSRATDADTGAELTGGTFTFIESGTVHAEQGWVATHNGTPTLGTDPITFTQFTSLATATGPAGGDLSGTYPNPDIAAGVVGASELASNAVTTAKIIDGAVTDPKVATANKDGTAATPSLRTLGTSAAQAAAGNDSRLSDSRTPTGAAGGDLAGTYPNPTLRNPAFFNVKAAPYSALGDNSNDDTAEIQAAIDAANTAGGGVVFFPRGTYICTTLTLYSKVRLVGEGIRATVITLKNSTNATLLKSYQYDSLVGTNSNGGVYLVGLFNLTLDGNKANNTAGDGLNIYGYQTQMQDVEIYNCKGFGLYSEWGDTSAVSSDTLGAGNMEAHVDGLYIHRNEGGGMKWFGPSDAKFGAISVAKNGPATGTTTVGIWIGGNAHACYFGKGTHVWGALHQYSYRLDINACFLDEVQGEGAQIAQCWVRAGGQRIRGKFFTGGTSGDPYGIKIGEAAVVNPASLDIDVRLKDCGIHFDYDGGDNSIKCHAEWYNAAKTVFTGTQQANNSNRINLKVAGDAKTGLTQWTGVNAQVATQRDVERIRGGWMPTGTLIENMNRTDVGISDTGTPTTTGKLYVVGGLTIPDGVTVSTITFVSSSIAGASLTNQWFALYDLTSLALLGVTNDHTTTAWPADTAKTLTLASAYTPTKDTRVYVAAMVAGTTMPSYHGVFQELAIAALPPVLATLPTVSGLTTPATAPNPLNLSGTTNSTKYAWVQLS